MYEDHSKFEKPGNERAKIWRYMDFTKFVSLLDKSALFFPRADKLDDPFEGSYPKANIDLIKAGRGVIPEENLSTWREFIKYLFKCVAINSWHLSEYESAAMWRLYLKSNEGITIQSTFERLKIAFKEENHVIYIGKVRYIDYKRDWMTEDNVFYPLLHKRRSFEHERELRAILLRKIPENDKTVIDFSKPLSIYGVYVPVDLDLLIEKIYLAPQCPEWFLELVGSVTKKYGVGKEVKRTSLDDLPM